MKKKLLIPVLSGFLLMSANLFAQAVKIGHINSAELLSLMPESKTADGELQKFGQSLEAQLKTMGAEYQTKLQDYQSKESLMADAIKQTKEKEILDLQGRIQEFQQTAQESIQKKKEELYSPVLKKAEDAINEVAKENGYTYVLDSSLGVVLYKLDGNDLGPLVKKKLGLPLTSPAAAPATGGLPIKK
jgi:outer membrane protein